MKKIISFILVLTLLCGMVSMFAPVGSAANTVDTGRVKKNMTEFLTFMKKQTYSESNACYSFKEQKYLEKDKITTVNINYYYYTAGFVQIACKLEYPATVVKVNFKIPVTYTGTAVVECDYKDTAGETLLAQATISVPNYTGKNAAFKKTGGNTAETDISAHCNRFANLAFINADNTMYGKGRIETGLTGLGFAGTCINHLYEKKITPASVSKSGTVKSVCHWCARMTTKTIAPIAKIELSKTAFYYNGKVQTPKVTVKDANGNVIKGNTHYTLSYSKGRKAVGKYAVKVKFKGEYSGTATLSYTINPVKTAFTGLTAAKKGFSAKWKKVSGVTGYQLRYSTKADFSDAKTVAVKGAAKLATKLTGLQAATKYYVSIRTYKTVKFGTQSLKIYSGWSAAKAVKTK